MLIHRSANIDYKFPAPVQMQGQDCTFKRQPYPTEVWEHKNQHPIGHSHNGQTIPLSPSSFKKLVAHFYSLSSYHVRYTFFLLYSKILGWIWEIICIAKCTYNCGKRRFIRTSNQQIVRIRRFINTANN